MGLSDGGQSRSRGGRLASALTADVATVLLCHAAPDAGVLGCVQGPIEAFEANRTLGANLDRPPALLDGRSGCANGEEQLGVLFDATRPFDPIHLAIILSEPKFNHELAHKQAGNIEQWATWMQ